MHIANSGRAAMPAGLPACRQYINFRLVPKSNGKTDKLPLDLAGNVIDPHNSTFWTDAATAWASPFNTHGIGWLVTLGFIVIDLDGCLVNGAWSPLALELCAAFSGAYVDVTPSGTGLRIICRGVLPDGHRCRFDGGEVYSLRRFVTITGNGARGDANWDAQYLMPWLVERLGLHPEPVVEIGDVEPDAGRLAEHLTDEQLIAKMVEQKPASASQMMGATMAQKWHVDAEACARLFPAEGRSDGLPFNHSDLDMSIASDLAYWTGHDVERMERLFTMWPGYRSWKYATRARYHMNRVLRRALTNKSFYGARQVALLGSAVSETIEGDGGVIGRYLACMTGHNIYDRENRKFIPTKSIDDRLGSVPIPGMVDSGGMPKRISASKYLFKFARVDDVTWFPGQPEIIEGYAMRDGTILVSEGNRLLNTYKPPLPVMGNANDVGPWLNHVYKLYPTYGDLILRWMCFVAQNPGKKINHALVLGGPMRVGKDACILNPLIKALGDWNCQRTSPKNILKSEWNAYLKSVLLCLDEARDTGGESRYDLHEQMKTIIAAPPSTHRINPKKQEEMIIPNINNTVIGTNHLQGGLYLPSDDGRHLVTWTNARRGQDGLDDAYFEKLWNWFDAGGAENCAAYLMSADVSDFKPYAMPVKTPAFWAMVEGGQSQEHHDMADLVEMMKGQPFSADQMAATALLDMHDKVMHDWLKDKRNGTKIVRSLTELGCILHENPNERRGRWVVNGKQVKLYRKT